MYNVENVKVKLKLDCTCLIVHCLTLKQTVLTSNDIGY